MEVIRTTSLGAFRTCAFKTKNEPYDPNPKNMYHGDLFNVGVTSRGDFGPLLDYYTEYINPDLGLKYNLALLMEKAGKFIDGEKAKEQGVFQEAKLYLNRNENIWIEGVPDVYTIHAPDEEGIEVDCYDLKCSTRSRYTGEEMWNLNLQTYIYPLMLMKVYKKDSVRFAYIVGDKGNGKVKKISKIRTRKECEDKLAEVMQLYIHSNMVEEYKPRQNKLCRFCSVKNICPLRANGGVTRTEDSLFD